MLVLASALERYRFHCQFSLLQRTSEMHWFFLVLVFYQLSLIRAQANLPLVLFISLHGFRSDYSKLYGPLPNFQRLAQRGVHTLSMIPTFNTATIPNHYTYVLQLA